MADPDNTVHYIKPVAVDAPAEQVIAAVEQAVIAAGAEVVQKSDDRLEALFVTKIFRFKDDVTFFVDTDAKLLHFRSASRVGHSDLGANRKRMTALIPSIEAAL